MAMSVLLDFVYFFKQSFSTRAFFYPYAFIVWSRFGLLLIMIPALIYHQVIKFKCQAPAELNAEEQQRRLGENRTLGFKMYTGLPFMQFSGFHRLLAVKNFSRYVGTGLFVDLVGTLCLVFLQGLNNSTVVQDLAGFSNTKLQSLALITKFVLIIDIGLECLMFGFELY